MIYYKLFKLFPTLTSTAIPEFNKSKSLKPKKPAGGAIFFPKSAGVKPSITTEDYRRIFKDMDKNMMDDLENYDIYLIDQPTNEEEIKGIIEKILEERD